MEKVLASIADPEARRACTSLLQLNHLIEIRLCDLEQQLDHLLEDMEALQEAMEAVLALQVEESPMVVAQ